MKHLIIVNPTAGQTNENLKEENIKKCFDGLNFEIHFTARSKESTSFLRQYFKNNKEETRVYACGGDGTINEIVNGIVGVANAELAIYAAGTGNDFVKVYGGPDKFHSFESLINGSTTEVDLSVIEGESLEEPLYSINVINLGFDAIVGAMGIYYKENGLPEKAKKKGLGPYDWALKNDAMKHGRFNDTEIYADGEKLNEKQLLLATLAQGQFVGGQFNCSPKSNNTDGLIDVCVLKTMTFLGLGMIIGPYTKGQHLNKPKKKIVYRQAKEVKIVAPKEIDVCVDGEMIKGSNFTVKVAPKAIRMVIPQ